MNTQICIIIISLIFVSCAHQKIEKKWVCEYEHPSPYKTTEICHEK